MTKSFILLIPLFFPIIRGGATHRLHGSKSLAIRTILSYYYFMPTVMRIGSFRFHFYSDEGNEPPHIHVETPDGECKFWLQPVRLARNRGVPPLTIRKIEKLIFENQFLLMGKYNESRNK